MGFNSGFKGLIYFPSSRRTTSEAIILSVDVCVSPNATFWTSWPIFMKLGTNILPMDPTQSP